LVRNGDVAGFAAVRAIVETVRAELHTLLAFADRAVLVTIAAAFGLVALHAKSRATHEKPPPKLYMTLAEASKPDVAAMRPFSYFDAISECRVSPT
jgi:hypothetical protein